MRPLALLLLTIWLLHGCAVVRPVTSGTPLPMPSAIHPAVTGRGDSSFAHRGMETLRSHLSAGQLETINGALVFQSEKLTAGCIRAEGSDEVLICQYGPNPDRLVAQALFWQEGGHWLGQLYPDAPEWLANERRQHFRATGCACQGRVRQARVGPGEQGPELLVVVDLGSDEGPMEEVHLLQLANDSWSLAWAPAPGGWNWGHAQVKLGGPGQGLTTFGVRSSSWGRQDRFAGYLESPAGGEHRWFTERWVRKGASFALRDQAEEAGPYGALVRLVFYLSHRDERRAQGLLGPQVTLEAARKALAQQPPGQGWGVVKEGPASFRLDRDGDGKADLSVTFAETPSGWVLAQVGPG